MASSATYYTCSPYSTPQLLRNSGEEPLELTIRYVYEVDIPTAATTTTEETTAALTNAIHHISTTLLQRMATISNLVDCSDTPNPFRQRQLRYKGRGSNSIIGLSSDPNTVWSDGVCQQQQQLQAAAAAGGDRDAPAEENEVEEMEKFMEGVTTGFSGSAVIMEEVEQEGDRGEPERQEEDTDNAGGAGAGDILAETRVDGVIDPASVVRSASLLPNQPSSSASSTSKKQQLEEIQEAGSAYNYLSTQSEIQEFTSIRTQPNVGGNSLPGSNTISLLQSSVTMTPPKLRNGSGSGGASGTTTTCNVIQGQMTLFISNNSDPFENLDERMLDAIKVDLNDETIVKQEFLNEMVLGIRLLEPAMEKNSPSVSITTSAAAATTTASSSNINHATGGLSSGFTSSYASIGVIAGLGGIFLILIGLFAYTSRSSKRRSRLSSSSSCDYGDDKYETEMDAKSALFIGKQSDYNMANDNFHSSSTDTSSGLEEEEGEEQLSVIDMDDAPSVVVEESKSRKTKSFGRLFGRNNKQQRHHSVDDSEDVMIDDDIVIEKVEAIQEGNDFGIGQTEIQEDAYGGIETTTTRTAPMRPMSAYISPTAVNSRPRCEKVYCTENNRTLQTCASGVTSCLTGIPAPEIGEDGSYDISALTDNDQYSTRRGLVPGCDDQFSTRGLPTGCTQATDGGEQLIRAAKGAMKQCVAPTDDQSVTTRSSRSANTRQLARRQQPNVDTMGVFADCWNPFEGNFWQGWFE